MIKSFNKNEYSPSVLEILGSKPNWFIRYGTLVVVFILVTLLSISTLIKVQNNINVQLLFYKNGSENNILNNSLVIKTYFNKLSQFQNRDSIYALLKSPTKILSNLKIGQTILLQLNDLSLHKGKYLKCTILSFNDDIFDRNQIIIVGFNSKVANIIKLYTDRIIKAKIIMKKVSIFNKFRYKVKFL